MKTGIEMTSKILMLIGICMKSLPTSSIIGPLMSKSRKVDCPCWSHPFDSKCGVWEGNESACLCVDLSIAAYEKQPLPS